MSAYAKKFVDEKINEINKNKSDNFTKIAVRLEGQDFLMIKELSKGLNFPITTAFTDLINDNLFDMISHLSKKDLEDFNQHFLNYEGGALSKLRQKKIINSYIIELA